MDFSKINGIFAAAAPIFLIAGIIEGLPTGIDLPVSSTYLLLSAIGCYLASK